jgi:hypothetical protein
MAVAGKIGVRSRDGVAVPRPAPNLNVMLRIYAPHGHGAPYWQLVATIWRNGNNMPHGRSVVDLDVRVPVARR